MTLEPPTRDLLLADTPFIDVRAEVEFDKGAFPSARSLPILTTDERHRVGKTYKERGQDAAVALGHELVSGAAKEARIAAWCAFKAAHPAARIYCWRGGMRSRIAQDWMAAAGQPIVRVAGGFKALRQVALDEFADAAQRARLFIIGGRTGSNKTGLIRAVPGGVDLEGFAHHRGSSFGRRAEEPPTQIDFEHALCIDVMKKRGAADRGLFLEDEGRCIGSRNIPQNFFEAMRQAPLAIVETPLEARARHILDDYVIGARDEHRAVFGEDGDARYREGLLAALHRIRKRLGPAATQDVHDEMTAALDAQLHGDDPAAHLGWIRLLLTGYYDKMYGYQLDKAQDRIVFRGTFDEVQDWARAQGRATGWTAQDTGDDDGQDKERA